MGKITNFITLFSKSNNNDQNPTTPKSSSSSSNSSFYYSWPSCTHPKTKSFRYQEDNNIYKTMNMAFYSDPPTDSSYSSDADSESIISNLKASNRLFFEPGTKTSSIMELHKNVKICIKEKSNSISAVAMESKSPYRDFRRSMEEMIVAYDMMKDWDGLEEMLVWYLKVNGEINHGFIVDAFVDLLVDVNSRFKVCEGCESMCSIEFETDEVEESGSS